MHEGRWKGAGLGDYYCSVCGFVVGGSKRTKECPECHAVMDDFEEDGDIEDIIFNNYWEGLKDE